MAKDLAPRQFFTLPSWVPQPPLRTESEESEAPSETTLFPLPEPSEDGRPASTKRDDPRSSVVMEESTISRGLTTKTDSGRTVTVPNDEVVTVTRRTTIVTDKPPSFTTIPTVTTLPPRPPPDQTPTSTAPIESGTNVESDGAPPATGLFIGVGVGGAALVALFVIAGIIIKRRLKRRREEGAATTRNDEDFGVGDRDEKYFPQQMSAHTTGDTQVTQASGDPFAPFGGRVDVNSDYPNRPASNTFEMDARPAVPVELPDNAVTYAAPSPSCPPPARSASANTHKMDPRANLEVIQDDDGNQECINHWNQYRVMG